MPETLALMLIASIGVQSVALSNILFLGITSAISIGASLGLNILVSTLFAPSAPRPEDVQVSTKQAVAPRYRHYGRVKVSGSWAFAENKNGNFYKVLALGQGPADAIEEFWLDDNEVTLDSDGDVTQTKYIVKSGASCANIKYRLGTGTDTYYSTLASVFPSKWTTNHRGRGVISLFATQRAVGSSYFMKVFPNSINTTYRVVLRGCLIENPITDVTEWNDNAAGVIRDYLYHAEGLRLPKSLLTTPDAEASWQTAWTKAGTLYTLLAGGTQKRYRLWGSYSLEERPADVLSRMLKCCDGRLGITPDGGLKLVVGDFVEPTVTIDESMIVAVTDLGRGRDIITTANVIRATYMNPASDYQTADADPWEDAADISLRGEIAADHEFIMSPHHAQTRRLMKIESHRANPNWVGTFTCNLKALAAFGERFIRIQYKYGINEVFELNDFRFNIDEYGILKTVTLQVASLPGTAYEWTPEEEGEEPVSDDTDGESEIPVPTDFNAVIQRKTISGTLYPYAYMTFDAPPEESLQTKARGKKTSDATWTEIAVDDDAVSADSFLLEDGEEYEFQVAYYSYSTATGGYTSSIVLTATADPTAPGIITSLVATPDDPNDEVDFSWQSPNSANFDATNIYRNTVNTFGTATLIYAEYGAANFPFTHSDPVTPGTYYYWFTSRNASGVESATVATGAITVV